MKYDDYIWDLGGTLLDNYKTSARAFEETLRMHGVEADLSGVYEALRQSTDFAVDRYARNIPNFLADYKERERESLEDPVLFKGARTVLSGIVEAGGRNFMISHRDHHVLEILQATGISQYFTEVVTSDNGFPRKPSPDSIDYLVEKYQMTRPVMIGDRPLDIEAGQNAGISTIYFSEQGECPSATNNVHELKEILDL